MRVAVLGGGYAGLTAARRLEDRLPEAAELVVVDESGTHLVQHELHRVIRRPSLADELTMPLTDVLDRAAIVEARVEAVDAGSGTVDLANAGTPTDHAEPPSDGTKTPTDGAETSTDDAETLSYDAGIVALGAQTAYYDLPGVEEHATPLKRVEHARAIRRSVEPVLEAGGRIVVAGAGLSGIQVAGEVAAMRRERESDAVVVLVEQRETVAPTFPPAFQDAVREALEDRRVVVRTGSAVVGADESTVSLASDEAVPYDELVWTGGIRGPEAMAGDRPRVRSDLRLAGETFVAGDVARVVDDRGRAVPASARTAIGQARIAATNVAQVVDDRLDPRSGSSGFSPRLDRYVDADLGWIVSVGDGAVASVGGRVLTGRAALALKASVGAGYLGRVGAVRRAVDLVRAEFEMGDADDRETEPGPPRND